MAIFTKRRMLIVASALVVCAALLWAGSSVKAWAFINRTGSAPEGVYVRDAREDVVRGEYVAMDSSHCELPYPVADFLIKRVYALEGDEIRTDDQGVWVNGEKAAGERVADAEATKYAVDVNRRLGPGEVFLLNEPEISLDSRYFGPVGEDCLVPVKLVWEW